MSYGIDEPAVDGQKQRWYKRRAEGRKVAVARKKALIGIRFGKLMVLERYAGASRLTGHSTWLCQCDCGRETIVDQGNLRRGNTKSCGCYNHSPEHNAKISAAMMGNTNSRYK